MSEEQYKEIPLCEKIADNPGLGLLRCIAVEKHYGPHIYALQSEKNLDFYAEDLTHLIHADMRTGRELTEQEVSALYHYISMRGSH